MKKTCIVILLIAIVMLSGCIKIKQPCSEDQQATEAPSNLLTGGAVVEPTKPAPSEPEKEPVPVTPKPAEPERTPSSDIPVKKVTAGELVSFPNLDAVDPDGEALAYTFSKPLDEKGEWLTTADDVGSYQVTITVSDGKNTVERTVMIVVEEPEYGPKIDAPERVSIDEGELLEIPIKITDPDGDAVSQRISGWITELPYQVGFDDQGTHKIYVHASDGKQESVHEIEIAVRDVNRAPVIAEIGTVNIDEGDKVTIKPKGEDPDGDALSYRFTKPLDPQGSWTPQEGDEGSYEVQVFATDGIDEVKTTFTLVVQTKDKPPVISGLKDLQVKEGEIIRLQITAEDPEGQDVTINYDGYMNDDTLVVGYDDAGVHTVRVTASDGTKTSTESFKVTVLDVNRPPVFTADAFE